MGNQNADLFWADFQFATLVDFAHLFIPVALHSAVAANSFGRTDSQAQFTDNTKIQTKDSNFTQ